jgi:hypothetical protein
MSKVERDDIARRVRRVNGTRKVRGDCDFIRVHGDEPLRFYQALSRRDGISTVKLKGLEFPFSAFFNVFHFIYSMDEEILDAPALG